MSYTLKVEHNKNTDEYYFILPPGLLKELGWKEGDNIEWKLKKDGSISLKKVK
jgi:bifunctional DNA-binding transcriptional regulator/antitoxin component of YhaV-PrlF toxin-antitoxin module